MMTSLILLLTPATILAPAKKKELQLFGNERWYKSELAAEKEFVGVLKHIKGRAIGFGRFNPYRLEMEKETREVYLGGKPNLLKDYIGKRVRIKGKAVDIGVEGKLHREIWPASLTVVAKKAPPKDKTTKKDTTKKNNVKILGRMPYRRARTAPGGNALKLVIRNRNELTRAMQIRVADVPGYVAKRMGVKMIDFKKHMILIASHGAKRTRGYRLKIRSITKKGKHLVV